MSIVFFVHLRPPTLKKVPPPVVMCALYSNLKPCVDYSPGTDILRFQHNHTSIEDVSLCQCLKD